MMKTVRARATNASGPQSRLEPGNGGNGSTVHVDAADEPAIQPAVVATVSEFGKFDILVNIAGRFPPHDEAGWHRSIDIFLKGTYAPGLPKWSGTAGIDHKYLVARRWHRFIC
jgi:NAD(P)-dependent dehydrogenase (short-subunit alcohol dehydrogenase family)